MAASEAAASSSSSSSSATDVAASKAVDGGVSSGAGDGIPVVDRSSVEAIQDRYRGQALVERLRFLAKADETVRDVALKAAAEAAKALGGNPTQYVGICEDGEMDTDTAWVEDMNSKSEQKILSLERDLNMHLGAQDRSGIQRANTELGKFYTMLGETSQAISSFMRAKEYCTPAQLQENVMLALKAALQGKHTEYVGILSRQALATSPPLSSADESFVHAAVGLSKINVGDIAGAAVSLLRCGGGIGSRFNSTIHNDDVTVAATLCALASMDRSTRSRLTQGSLEFRRTVSSCPDVALISSASSRGDFGTAVRTLEAMMPALTKDAVLGPVAGRIRKAILERLVVESTSPYSRVSVPGTASTLCIREEELTAIVVGLIESGRLPFRLDGAAGVLVAKFTDQRRAVFAKAMSLAQTVEEDTKAALLRASLLSGGFSVTMSKAEKRAAMKEQVAAGATQGHGSSARHAKPGRR